MNWKSLFTRKNIVPKFPCLIMRKDVVKNICVTESCLSNFVASCLIGSSPPTRRLMLWCWGHGHWTVIIIIIINSFYWSCDRRTNKTIIKYTKNTSKSIKKTIKWHSNLKVSYLWNFYQTYCWELRGVGGCVAAFLNCIYMMLRVG